MQVRANRPRGFAALGAMLIALLALAAVLSATATPSAAAPTAAAGSDAAAIACGTTMSIGFAAPITGPAASAGAQMLKWGQFAQTRWNRAHRMKIRLVQGDTQLPDTAQAVRVAEGFASNQRILAIVGPAGSQEVAVSTAPFRRGGVGNISGTATATDLTTSGTRRGFFFRTVPNDEQQAARAVAYMRAQLQATRIVIIDAQNSYSVGLADAVQRLLGAAGVTAQRESVNEATVTDFSSLVARIPNNTQVVYIPWQLAAESAAPRPAAPCLGQERHALRRGRPLRSGRLQDPGFDRDGLPRRSESSQSSERTRPGRATAEPTCSAFRATSRSTSPLAQSRRPVRTGRPHAPRSGVSSTRRMCRRSSLCSGSASGSSRHVRQT